MKGLSYGLRAKNSTQDVRLFVDKQDDGVIAFTLAGEHDGQYIQIDFDELDTHEAQELADFIRQRAGTTR